MPGLISSLSDLRQQSQRARVVAKTTCDVARSLCKPVDDFSRGYSPGYGYNSGYNSYPNQYSTFRPVATTPSLGWSPDKSELLQAAKSREIVDRMTQIMADGVPDG